MNHGFTLSIQSRAVDTLYQALDTLDRVLDTLDQALGTLGHALDTLGHVLDTLDHCCSILRDDSSRNLYRFSKRENNTPAK